MIRGRCVRRKWAQFLPRSRSKMNWNGSSDLKASRPLHSKRVGCKVQNDAYATIELANYWKDNNLFQGMILHYDTLDPSPNNADVGTLQPDKVYHAEIIVVMPSVNDYYEGRFDRSVRTDINFRAAIYGGLGYFQYK